MANLTVAKARDLIAASRRGGKNDDNVKSDALDALQMALGDLNTRDFEFLRVSAASVATASADVATYSISSNLRKVYSIVWNNTHSLHHVSQRIDDRARPVKTSSTPTHYDTVFSDSVSGGVTGEMNVRLFPTPSTTEDGILFRVTFYDKVIVATATSMAYNVPSEYQYWPVYQGKANLLMDCPGKTQQASFWQQKANAMWREMVHMDQVNPDQDTAFMSRASNVRNLPPDHAWYWVQESDGGW